MSGCRTCGAVLFPYNKSGLCKDCILTDPGMKAKRAEGLRKRVEEDPELLQARVAHIPPELRDEYHALRRGKRVLADDVTRILREAHPGAFKRHEAAMRKAESRSKKSEAERYMAYRLRVLPAQLAAARRKVQALENEARRLGILEKTDD